MATTAILNFKNGHYLVSWLSDVFHYFQDGGSPPSWILEVQ